MGHENGTFDGAGRGLSRKFSARLFNGIKPDAGSVSTTRKIEEDVQDL
jgi:hypothetical protein